MLSFYLFLRLLRLGRVLTITVKAESNRNKQTLCFLDASWKYFKFLLRREQAVKKNHISPLYRLSWVLLFQDKLVVECFSQLKMLNKALAIRELAPGLGESGWREDVSRLQMLASEWKLKKSLLHAGGLVLRANILEDVKTGNILWSLGC